MKQIKRIAIIIAISILAILGISSVSNAYYVGQSLSLTYNDYIKSSNIYCVEHNQALKGRVNYRIISQVNIEGNKSTDYTGKSIIHSDNAKMAAILTADNGSIKDKGPVANGIWNFVYTWMRNVGQYHAGLYHGFASSKKGSTTSLNTVANQYADSIKNDSIVDNTKKENIRVVAYDKDGKQYMRIGPFNWSFAGNLTQMNIYDQNNSIIVGTLYSSFNGTTENWYGIGDIKSGNDFYVSIPFSTEISKITKIEAKTSIDVKGVNIWFLEARSGYYQNLIIREPHAAKEEMEMTFNYDIPILGHLKVIKVNQDNETVKLPGVGFYIQNKNTGKYIKQESNGTINYVDTKEQATEFVTDDNGEFTIKNLIVGTYVAYETKNPNYGYEIINEGQEKTITVDKTTDFIIKNKQIYVKLSGFVWVDKQDGKLWIRNNLYKTNYHPEDNDYVDGNDLLLDGITVRLKDTEGNTVKEAKTSEGGAYLFTDVLIENLSNYYIEFEYDGLTYTNVIPHLENEENGSKSAENSAVRDEFNQNFTAVEGKTENTGITRDSNGNEKHTLTYNLDKTNGTATLINNGQYPITANTNETGYRIKEHFTYGQEEIKYINLGLYEREQPDIAIQKDLSNVKIAVNGYNHVYQYSQVPVYDDSKQEFNVGVKFRNKYGSQTYRRAIYKADYEYTNEQDKSKELKVYVTYKIAMINASTNLTAQVNQIADYYDSDYTLLKAGRSVDQEKGEVNDPIVYTQDTNYASNGYSKAILTTNTKIEPQKSETIYVQFELEREAVLKLLNDQENLENVAEINSYSIFDNNGKIYAGIDVNSNPGNAIPEDRNTYQDDTCASIPFKLEVTDARELAGTVFLDDQGTTPEIQMGKIRQGNGIFDENEKGIPGVEVTFTETTGSGKEYKTTTDENGNFSISDYIPGKYDLTYTWGDSTYTVQNYKGTIYDKTRNQEDTYWYKTNKENRQNDAIDDWSIRQQIDDEMKTVTNNNKTTIDKMVSRTPKMEIGVEYDTTTTASMGDKYVYRIENIDFGIIERARQKLSIEKQVASFKVTLGSGQVIADITIDENGNITGEKNHITYMKPSESTYPKNGFIRLELDNELIQDARVEVTYRIKATNESELDYNTEEFYKYGIEGGSVVTLTPSAIIDYLDNAWGFEAEENPDWEVKTIDNIKDIVAEEVYNHGELENKKILYTEKLKDQKLEPGKSTEVNLKVSKVLTTTDEISLDNETEITKIEKTGGAKLISVPGNYIPGTGKTETDDSMAETVMITPSTGANQTIILPIIVCVVAFGILGVGIVFIKKKTLGENK